MHEYSGSIHMHSIFSDGTGDARDIAFTAGEVGLDFIILTDHNTLRAMDEGYEGFYNNTFLMVGTEINDKDNKNHYLALGINKTVSTRIPAKEYVTKVKEMGGIGFLAHPHEKRNAFAEHPPYPWLEWDTDDFTGIEIWNHMSEWMENLTEDNKLQSFVHPLKTIIAPPQETLMKWDELSADRKVVGIGGIDAHAHKVNIVGLFDVEVFPYKVLFKSIRTYILTHEKIRPGRTNEEIAAAKRIILDALKNGRCFVGNYYHGDPAGFRFTAETGGRIYNMGDTVELKEKIRLRCVHPADSAEIRFIHNGVNFHTATADCDEVFVEEPGVYRVEVWQDEKGWIFSNHIRVQY